MPDATIPEKVDRLIFVLLQGTKSRKVQWEDVSDPSEEMFRTTAAGGLIRIGRHTESLHDRDDVPQEKVYITISVYGSKGSEVAQIQYHLGSPSFAVAAELFDVAKSSARNSSQELDWMIHELQK